MTADKREIDWILRYLREHSLDYRNAVVDACGQAVIQKT